MQKFPLNNFKINLLWKSEQSHANKKVQFLFILSECIAITIGKKVNYYLQIKALTSSILKWKELTKMLSGMGTHNIFVF